MLRVGATAVALLALLPLFYVIGYTIGAGWTEVSQLVFRARTAELLWNTSELTVLTVLSCAGLGVGAAWLVERTDVPGRRLWNILLVAPLAVPAFVNSYAWVSLAPSLQQLGGAWLVVTLSYFPLVYLPVAAMLRGLDPALEETAYALGLGQWATFGRVVLPQLRPALFGGCLLVGLHLLAEFGALQMLQFATFTTAIYDQYRSSFSGPAANSLATVLVLACLILLLAELKLRGRARYARVGAGAARPATRLRLGVLAAPAWVLLAALIGLALAVPVGSLGYWLATGSSTAFPLDTLASTLLSSLGLGVVAAVLTTVLAVPVAWLTVRHHGRFATVLERSTYFASALPGIVIALALVTLTIRFAQPLYQTGPVLVAAYVILFLPMAMVNVRAAFEQAPPLYDEVATGLGAGALSRLARVTLPLIGRGLGAGTALVFLSVVTELTATLLLAPLGTDTLATKFWSFSSSLSYGAAAPYAALMVAISLPATYLLTRTAAEGLPT
ncbi:MAG: iron ABC transporter permease [Actinomycetota bacterium]|nr:iron ABC transporter permease [Actinomycetota bacterium]